jgi:hypothetical protein
VTVASRTERVLLVLAAEDFRTLKAADAATGDKSAWMGVFDVWLEAPLHSPGGFMGRRKVERSLDSSSIRGSPKPA